MSRNLRTPVEMNLRHREFWASETRAFERRWADPQLREMAFEDMDSEISRGVPVYSQKPLEFCVFEAERRRTRIRSSDGGRGGRPRRGDPLQEQISDIVRPCPKISEKELLDRLRSRQVCGVIEDVDDEDVYYVDARGVGKKAPISGLKDRLSRARKSLSSRQPV